MCVILNLYLHNSSYEKFWERSYEKIVVSQLRINCNFCFIRFFYIKTHYILIFLQLQLYMKTLIKYKKKEANKNMLCVYCVLVKVYIHLFVFWNIFFSFRVWLMMRWCVLWLCVCWFVVEQKNHFIFLNYKLQCVQSVCGGWKKKKWFICGGG